jgi:hypothetical protein
LLCTLSFCLSPFTFILYPPAFFLYPFSSVLFPLSFNLYPLSFCLSPLSLITTQPPSLRASQLHCLPALSLPSFPASQPYCLPASCRLQIYLIRPHFTKQGWMADFKQPGGLGTIAAGFLQGTRNQIFFHYLLGDFER